MDKNEFKDFQDLLNYTDELEWRIKKAIELIENNYYLREKEKYIIEEDINETLRFLKGDSNE